MSKKAIRKEVPEGARLLTGGFETEVEALDDRITVAVSTPRDLEHLRTAARSRPVRRIARGLFLVETSSIERDGMLDAIRTGPHPLVAHHAYRPKGQDGTVYYLTDRIVVRFKRKAKLEDMEAVLVRHALAVVETAAAGSSAFVLRVSNESGANPIKIAARLRAEPTVKTAEVDLVYRVRPAFRPTDSRYPKQWYLDARGGHLALDPKAGIDVEAAWDVTTGDPDVTIAILDDGFELGHSDFDSPGKIVQARDFADEDQDPSARATDVHGTPCAGVALAVSNGIGIVGVAPDCRFMPIRIPFANTFQRLATFFQEAARHARIISCSWGPEPADAPICDNLALVLSDLAANGGPGGLGCVIVFAAGNYGSPVKDLTNANGRDWFDPATDMKRHTSGPIVNGLAAHPDVVCVSACTSVNRRAAYSNWGRDVMIAAPSNDFVPGNRGALVHGMKVVATANSKAVGGLGNGSGYTDEFGGTSCAAALVAGVAGLVISANPSLRSSDVREILRQTADKIVDPGADPRAVYVDGRCDWFGYGKVNAGAAVREARRGREAAATG